MPKSIPGLDLLKYFMATMIVSIHCNAFDGFIMQSWLKVLQSLAVPTFFLLSSFFFMKKVRERGTDWDILLLYLKRIAIMYGIWFIINLPIFYSQHHTTFELLKFVKNIFFRSTFEGSWFLSALALSITTIFVLLKYHIPEFIIAVMVLVVYQIIESGG